MYERFTEKARSVMDIANQKAIDRHHEYIGTEHILAALCDMDGETQVIERFGLSPDDVRKQIDAQIVSGPEIPLQRKLPQTPRAKKVIECALKERETLFAREVQPEHILLGLLREQEGIAAKILMQLGLNIEDAYTAVRDDEWIGQITTTLTVRFHPSQQKPSVVTAILELAKIALNAKGASTKIE